MLTTPTDEAERFHTGECLVQERAGSREKLARVGSQVIRDYMPEQHRNFFAQLPFVLVGAVDAKGQPWASILSNPPGFINTPDNVTMQIKANTLPADPLHAALVPGASIGLLGIEPHTRRRNRMNGVVDQMNAQGMLINVRQSFGNCPKYIQARKPTYVGSTSNQRSAAIVSATLDDPAQRIIASADTFFIATAHPMAANTASIASQGVDVSHRGGWPGFVRVNSNTSLTAPDYVGNFFFNTLGNLTLNPKAGLLFVDFDRGDLLYIAVSTEIVWGGADLGGFAGAERLLRFSVRQVIRLENALPIKWGKAELSPYLERMS